MNDEGAGVGLMVLVIAGIWIIFVGIMGRV